jgi:TonB-dependent receptor
MFASSQHSRCVAWSRVGEVGGMSSLTCRLGARLIAATVLALTASRFASHAQALETSGSGAVTGRVVHAVTGLGVPGVTVTMVDGGGSTNSDLNGAFRLDGVAAGSRNVVATKEGFAPVSVTDVIVQPGLAARVEVSLTPMADVVNMEAFTVSADLVANSGIGLLDARQRSAVISDAIGGDEISRLGFGNAAVAMRAVTGASVIDGRYVFIRGLGERYSSTSLDGAEVPSADPDRRAVQLDLFPAELTDAIVTSKTFTPDRPGNFTGGNVDIRTKSFPEERTLGLSFGLSGNSRVTGKSRLGYVASERDWLGRDDGARQLPAAVASTGIPPRFSAPDAVIGEMSRSFTPVMTPRVVGDAPLNRSAALAFGDRFDFGTQVLGVVVAANYDRSFGGYRDGRLARHELQGIEAPQLSTTIDLADWRSTEEVTAGGMAKVAWQPSSEHEITFTGLANLASEDTARLQTGLYLAGGGLDETQTYTTRTLKFVERELTSAQVAGRHLLPRLEEARIEWHAARSRNVQDEPDTRFFNMAERRLDGGSFFDWQISGLINPARYFRRLTEEREEFSFDVTLPLERWIGRAASFKAGYHDSDTDRVFRERQFVYRAGVGSFNGDAEALFAPGQVGQVGPSGLFLSTSPFLQDSSSPRNNYDGAQEISSWYGMFDLRVQSAWRAVFGVRYENTDIVVTSQDVSRPAGVISERDALPAVSVVYELSRNVNLRAAYGRTLARPNFREIAPYETFEFAGDFVFIGNPELQRTLVDNYDVRWEWFPRGGEIVAASVFYKELRNPIERAIFAPAGIIINQGEVQYRNQESANVYGLELEYRQSLGRYGEWLKAFSVGANLTYTESKVPIAASELMVARAFRADAPTDRPLSGQSKYLANLDLSYRGTRGTVASVYYNVFGERLATVAPPGTPDIFEQPAPTLDLVISQRLGRAWRLGFKAQNLLDPAIEQTQTYRGVEYVRAVYHRGRVYSLSIDWRF